MEPFELLHLMNVLGEPISAHELAYMIRECKMWSAAPDLAKFMDGPMSPGGKHFAPTEVPVLDLASKLARIDKLEFKVMITDYWVRA